METIVIIKVALHCRGCLRDVKKAILKTKGVQTADADFKSKKFTVKGTMNPKDLLDVIKRRTGKCAEIVKKDSNPVNHQINNVPFCVIDRCHIPQLLSDDNPNACTLM